ncbi:DNA-binding PadR family transcriptional regulator [Chitinophaga sp. W2I13]|uniref:hypothetical protein n=1 Tax=Chitinophaga sp. W2I13 TaxID=3373923 RepID=UPI003D209AD3
MQLEDDSLNKKYRDRLRILLIIYFFSEPYSSSDKLHLIGVLKSEVKIQKLDFLIRYPSYLCYELILKLRENPAIDQLEIKNIVRKIIKSEEPQIRTIDMKKFLYGAWEYLDRTISFLKAHGLIDFKSELGKDFKQRKKEYYLTTLGKTNIEKALKALPSIGWYAERCELIKKYFGDLGGTDLKALQYQHEEYKDAMINQYIQDIEQQTTILFKEEFKEAI